jgi:3-oxocholest-4-en-26-oyl-CoA dehydrogenase beta subunit
MDFSFSDEQQALADLARRILEDQTTAERLREVEASPDRIDRRTWSELAKANLLGIPIPESLGGLGMGFLEVALLLEQQGRTVAPVPLLPTLVLGALPLVEFGTDEQKKAELPAIAGGERIFTAALVEPSAEFPQLDTVVRRDGDGWRLDGAKTCVPAGMVADRMLVPARSDDGSMVVFVVDMGAAGVSRVAQETTDRQLEAHVELDGVRVPDTSRLGDAASGRAIVESMRDWATAALCVTSVGVCETALRLTAEYTKSREQFDRVIATFQAVGQRAADAYIDTEAVRLTAWQAAWRISAGLPASTEVAVAKFWSADGGQRVVHAAQHLHGGIGVDRDYPLHRYFLWAKHLELSLGGATSQLLRLGAALADEPAEV